MSSNHSVTVEILKEFLEAFNRHDLDAIMEFFADDCSLYMPRGPKSWGQRLVGKSNVRKGLASRFAGLPDVHYGDDNHWACENMGVSKWTLTGTTTSGIYVEVQGVDLLEFREGKIVQKDSYWKIVDQL